MNNRYDFIYLFDVRDGNPNGDPDAGNLPRIDPDSGAGLVTDVCLKRKVRNYVGLVKGDSMNYGIFVREKAVLNDTIERAYRESNEVKKCVAEWEVWKSDKKAPKPSTSYEDIARDWLCDNFFDIRTFGAVLSTGDKEKEVEGIKNKIKMKAGQVRGPVQLTFARSEDPIVTQEHAITRMAVTNEDDLKKERTIGRKFTVPYGLYRCHGFVSAKLATRPIGTGFSDDDLALFWQALESMFENDRSASRGEMTPRALIVFKHDSDIGNAPAWELFDAVKVERVAGEKDTPAHGPDDYAVAIDKAAIPAGVTMEVKFLGLKQK